MTTRFVVLAPNWLGDAVMALPAIADLRRAEPDAHIAVAARPAVAPLFTMVPGIDHVITMGDRAATTAALRAGVYDVALLLPNSFNAALLARRAGIGERWGYRADFRTPLLSRGVAPPPRVHQAEYYQQLTRRLGFPSGSLEPRLEAGPDLRRAAAAQLTAAGWNGCSPLVALAPGAAYGGAKRWPASSFAALAADLASSEVVPVLIGSSGDRAAGAEVVALLTGPVRPIDLIGQTTLPALAGVLTQCRALVTNDSGAMHLAAALGVSVTALFGPTNERETHPLGAGRRVVLTHRVWCRPCMLRECPLNHGCMRGITADRVARTVRDGL